MKRTIIVTVIMITLVVGAAIYFTSSSRSPLGPNYQKVEGYNKTEGPTCAAVAPECGTCFGEVRDGECWVDPNKLDDFEKQAMGVD